eukprot:5429722-Ditylum_brightwellii.AAC.1
MKTKEASIWGWAETNVNWTPNRISQANYLGQKINQNFKLVAASSNKAVKYKQMGEICTALVDNVVGRHIESGEDTSRLGRWTYISIVGKDHRKLYIITEYQRVSNQTQDWVQSMLNKKDY